MLEIYHNPRCSKSRECLNIMETSNHNFTVVKYLDDPLSEEKLRKIISLLGITPIELVRKNEAIWKEQYKGKMLNEDQIIQAILEHPKLMERPIVINGDKAIIGRPPESVLELLK